MIRSDLHLVRGSMQRPGLRNKPTRQGCRASTDKPTDQGGSLPEIGPLCLHHLLPTRKNTRRTAIRPPSQALPAAIFMVRGTRTVRSSIGIIPVQLCVSGPYHVPGLHEGNSEVSRPGSHSIVGIKFGMVMKGTLPIPAEARQYIRCSRFPCSFFF